MLPHAGSRCRLRRCSAQQLLTERVRKTQLEQQFTPISKLARRRTFPKKSGAFAGSQHPCELAALGIRTFAGLDPQKCKRPVTARSSRQWSFQIAVVRHCRKFHHPKPTQVHQEHAQDGHRTTDQQRCRQSLTQPQPGEHQSKQRHQ